MTFLLISIIFALGCNELSRKIEVKSFATCNGFSKDCLNSAIVNEVTWGIPTDWRHTSWLLTNAAKELNMGLDLEINTPVNVSPSQRLLMYLHGRRAVHDAPSFLWSPQEPLKK